MIISHIIYKRLRDLALMAAMAAAMLATGCQTDDNNIVQPPIDGEIVFGAAVHEISAAQTRALEVKDITRGDYGDVDFFIQLDYAKPATKTESSIKRYTVASSYTGRLDAKNSNSRLNWQDATSGHTFYAWTLPWLEDAEKAKYADEDSENKSCLDMYYDNDGKPIIKVEFFDSDDGDNFNKHKNNAILEKFIGAQIGPYNYKKQGTYVPLTFYHLVSQVRLGKLTVIRGDGSRHEDLKANLTFIGMPTIAVFDPHPYEEIKNPHPAEWITYPNKKWDEHPHHPVVIGPEEGYDEKSEITFFIPESTADGRPDDRFYVCPEIDFSKLMYKVVITTADALECGIEYYGDFSKVDFKRKNSDYDKADKTDDTVLHAGEIMTLNITLYPGVGPGATITIQDWSDPQPTESSHYAHPGIFTSDAAQELANAKTADMGTLFDLYGEKDDKGENIFHLYENVEITGSSFSVGEGYVLDGGGHQLKMSSSSGKVTIGQLRDIYITDGTNTIYIDADGYIWIYKDGTLTKTEKQLTTSGTINLEDGSIE